MTNEEIIHMMLLMIGTAFMAYPVGRWHERKHWRS